MAKMTAIINYLQEVQACKKDIICFTRTLKVTRAWELNLFFQEDKDLYVKEKIIHEKILPYPPPSSFKLYKWELIKEEYKTTQLKYVCHMSKEDYVDYLYHHIILELL